MNENAPRFLIRQIRHVFKHTHMTTQTYSSCTDPISINEFAWSPNSGLLFSFLRAKGDKVQARVKGDR